MQVGVESDTEEANKDEMQEQRNVKEQEIRLNRKNGV